MVSKGKNGIAYEIDPDEAMAWWRAHHQAESAKAAERQRQIDMWAAELYGPAEEEDGAVGLSAVERKALADAIRVEDYNRARRGELIERAPLAARLVAAMLTLRRDLLQIPADYCRA